MVEVRGHIWTSAPEERAPLSGRGRPIMSWKKKQRHLGESYMTVWFRRVPLSHHVIESPVLCFGENEGPISLWRAQPVLPRAVFISTPLPRTTLPGPCLLKPCRDRPMGLTHDSRAEEGNRTGEISLRRRMGEGGQVDCLTSALFGKLGLRAETRHVVLCAV